MTRIIALIFLVLTGCAATPQARIDGSTEATFDRSFTQMNRSLSGPEQTALWIALIRIHFMGVESALELVDNPELQNLEFANLREELDGMTLDEILEYAEQSAVTINIETAPP
jgi:hypothetical protein